MAPSPAAAAQGTRHGTAAIPSNLRIAFATSRWPGSPELRKIYLATADKAILSTARHLARLSITDMAERIGGINVDADTGELTQASGDLLEWEHCRSQKEHTYDIDRDPDLRLARFH